VEPTRTAGQFSRKSSSMSAMVAAAPMTKARWDTPKSERVADAVRAAQNHCRLMRYAPRYPVGPSYVSAILPTFSRVRDRT
jgi:hypothetical protein